MTKEELLKKIDFEKSWLCDCGIFGSDVDIAFHAIKKSVIEALEKESCEDAVSRQTVKEQMIYYGFHAPDMTVTEFVEDCLPSVTPHQATCEEKEKGECPFYAG